MKKLFYFTLGALAGAAAVHFVKKYYPDLTKAQIEAQLEELLAKIRKGDVEAD